MKFKYYTQKGVTLIGILIIWQCILLLTFYAYERIHVRLRMSKHILAKQSTLKAAKQFLTKIIKTKPTCQINPISIYQLQPFSLEQLRHFACEGKKNNDRFNYFYEDLGEDACAKIYASNKSANYSRYTVIWNPKSGQSKQITLQATVVKPVVSTLPCFDSVHFVKVGIQMWREIGT